MFVLLPPSEAKTPGGRGRAWGERLATPSGPLAGLAAHRERMAEALRRLVTDDPDAAARALLLPAGRAQAALAANAEVLDCPTMPGLRRYRGVVYDGLAADGFDAPTARAAGRCVLVFSGLLGVARGGDPVPDYRLPAKAALPGVGVVGTAWRPVLEEVLPTVLREELTVDLRSGDYAAMWRPDRAHRERTVTVRVVSPLARGGDGVVSHTSKLMKGRLAAQLLREAAAGQPAETVEDVMRAWNAIGGRDAQRTRDGLGLRTHTSTG